MSERPNNVSALDDQIRQLAEREPELPAEAVILHWFVRNVLMQEDLDAYEFVFDGRRESGGHRFDAGFVGEVEEESGSVSTVVNLVDLFNGSDESQLAKRLQELDAAAGVLDSARLLGAIDELGLSAPRKVVPEKSTLQIHVVAPNVTFADRSSRTRMSTITNILSGLRMH